MIGIEQQDVISIYEIIDDYDLIVFDIWGVFCEGNTPYQKAINTAQDIMRNKNCVFLTNAPRMSLDIAQNLEKLGLKPNLSQVFTAGEMSRQMLQNPKDYFDIQYLRLYNIGIECHTNMWKGLEVQEVQNVADANLIIMSRNCDATEIELSMSIHQDLNVGIDKKIKMLCTNPDKGSPNAVRKIHCAGHFAELYQNMGGKVFYAGKPFEPIFQHMWERTGRIDKSKVLMIGDTLDTDILGANRFGIHNALVYSGNLMPVIQSARNVSDQIKLINKVASEAGIVPQHLIKLT